MQAFPDPQQRTARFCCTLFVAAPDGRACQASGTCEGRIAHAPSGHQGFGYDPIFFLPEHDFNMAEIAAQQKNALSHRAKALKAVYPALQQTFPESASESISHLIAPETAPIFSSKILLPTAPTTRCGRAFGSPPRLGWHRHGRPRAVYPLVDAHA